MPEPSHIPDLKDVIDNADPVALRRFILMQAKKNSALSIKLRAYLVDGVESYVGVNKYSQVISLLVHHNVHGTIHLTRRSIQILRDISEHFIELQIQHLREGELRNAWDAGYAIISHFHTLMDKYHGPDPKLIAILSECYANVIELLRHSPAPELRQSIFSSLSEIAGRKHHVIYDLNLNAITCLIQSTSDKTDFASVTETLVDKLASDSPLNEANRKLWSALLLKIPDTRIDIQSFITHEQAYDIAHLLSTPFDTQSMSRLIHEFDPPTGLSTAQVVQWARWKLELALNMSDDDEIRKAAWDLLKLDQDLNTYRRVISTTSIHFAVEEIGQADVADDLRGDIYAVERYWEALTLHIQKTASLPLLIKYCEPVLEHTSDPDQLLFAVTHAYALHHAGQSSSDQIALLMETLHELHYGKNAVKLANKLKEEFPERFDDILKSKRRKRGYKPMVDFDLFNE